MKFLLPALLIALPMVAQISNPPQSPSSAKNAVGMEFAKIAPGEFMMGCATGDSGCDADEKPAHRVQITKAFEIGKYEVTQAQWVAVMGSNPSTIKGDDRPVESVSRDDAHDFLAKLNAKNDGYRYRLPTEAEWEYAARAGSTQAVSLDEVAWYADNSGDETHPVGQKKPNAWGLYDTLGNVREWVEDAYGANYYSNSPVADPTGPTPGTGQQGFGGGRGRGFRGGQGGPPPGGDPIGPGGYVLEDPSVVPQGPTQGPVDQNGQAGQGGQNGQPGPGQDGQGPPGGLGGQGFPGRGRRGFGRGNFGGGRQLPVIRGGAWDNPASFVRLSARYHYYGATLKASDLGFRAVREPVSP